jgi:hypothetical protein
MNEEANSIVRAMRDAVDVRRRKKREVGAVSEGDLRVGWRGFEFVGSRSGLDARPGHEQERDG